MLIVTNILVGRADSTQNLAGPIRMTHALIRFIDYI